MTELTRDQIRRRQAEFPRLIIEIAYNNKTVYNVIELYSCGAIVSKEEAYCQMVRELSTTYDQMMKRIVDEAHMKVSLFSIPPSNE